MFAEKPSFHSSNLRLPPIGKNYRERIRPPPTPVYSSRTSRAAHIAENVSALKAKYMDYTTWLKNSTQPNREPILTQELLKNSLCQMGIDSIKAERLVTTCSWYVYQFQKDLKFDPDQKDSIENQKFHHYKNKFKKSPIIKDHTDESTTTISSLDQGKEKDKLIDRIFLFVLDDSSSSSNSRLNHFVLPSINKSDFSTSSRFRRVDFGGEQTKKSIPEVSLSHWKSISIKTRLKPITTESSNPSLNLDLSSSQRSLRRNGLLPGHTRSILRKQPSISSSNTSHPQLHSRVLTPSSTIRDDIPLGTRSQRLFGGSECFAQIMNELEQQKKKF